MRPVFKGEFVMVKCQGGYINRKSDTDGIYLGPDFPIISRDAALNVILYIDKQNAIESKKLEKRKPHQPKKKDKKLTLLAG